MSMKDTAVEDLFIREETLNNTVGQVKASGVRDWKRWGRDNSKDLGIAVWLNNYATPNAANPMKLDKLTEGAVEVKLLSGMAENALTAIATVTASVADLDDAGRLTFFLLPRTGIKQFVKVEVKTTKEFKRGETAASANVSVGLARDSVYDIDSTMVQPKLG